MTLIEGLRISSPTSQRRERRFQRQRREGGKGRESQGPFVMIEGQRFLDLETRFVCIFLWRFLGLCSGLMGLNRRKRRKRRKKSKMRKKRRDDGGEDGMINGLLSS